MHFIFKKIIPFSLIIIVVFSFIQTKIVFADPIITFDSYGNIDDSSAIINVKVGQGTGTVDVLIYYGTDAANLTTPTGTQTVTLSGSDQIISFNLPNLQPSTHYFYNILNGTISVNQYSGDFFTIATSGSVILGPLPDSQIQGTCPEGEYCLLAPLPGLENSIKTSDSSIGNYLKIIIRIAIALAGVLAVVMLVIGGIQWMGSESVFDKDEGKKRIQNAIFGLLLAVGSYVILNTISPDLVNLSFSLQKEEIEIKETTDNGDTITIKYSSDTKDCPTSCVNLLPEVPIKNSSGTQVEKTLKLKLASLSQKLTSDQSINGNWGVTEAWQPSRPHKAACHPKGTCIDANFTKNPTPSDVKNFISYSNSSGLCSVYEVQSDQDVNIYVSAGVNPNNVKNYGSWISAPHFSVYGGACK